jgi:hypothetical protein
VRGWQRTGATIGLTLALAGPAAAGVGDPQVRTDHLWYPGELACSTFERLFATQAEAYRRVTGVEPKSDQEKALAAWLWRNTHFWHGEEGAEDLWGTGFTEGFDMRTREYWKGLFADGFGLCGTTHSQWIAEMDALLGHGRGRGVGVEGHNSFEVFLTGGLYGTGRWALLDHDLSTVVFNPEGTALLSIPEVQADRQRLLDPRFRPERQHGWPVCGLARGDGAVFTRFSVAEYLGGYSGPPPMVHLRQGETLRRYLEPGLADGKTFVFWGRNYNMGGIPGPERSLTWVNQPEKLYGSRETSPYKVGQARFANAVYTYRPDFTGAYCEGVIEESASHVVFEFQTPYIIGATPPNSEPWGVYDAGCRNGLVLRGQAPREVSLSTDRGKTWQACGKLANGMDLTDPVKGRRQYWIRFAAGAKQLANSGLVMTTVCQANSSILPRLKDGGSRVTFLASGRAQVSAGPNLPQAQPHVVEGAFGTPGVTLQIASPRREAGLAVYAAAHVLSGNPPDPKVKHQIEFSTDGGKTWGPVVKDWTVTRRGQEPGDFWSQSLCWGSAELPAGTKGPVRLRFRNDGGQSYARAEAHLVYRAAGGDGTRVTFDWSDDAGPHRSSHVFPARMEGTGTQHWAVSTGSGVRTRWVEFEPVPAR